MILLFRFRPGDCLGIPPLIEQVSNHRNREARIPAITGDGQLAIPYPALNVHAPTAVWSRARGLSLMRLTHSPRLDSRSAAFGRASACRHDKEVAVKKRKATVAAVSALPVIQPLVAGVDVGSREHWVAGPQQDPNTPNVRVFLTTTEALNELADWLILAGREVGGDGEHVGLLGAALRDPGVTEDRAVLVNARHLHGVPGRKTDMRDCQCCRCCIAAAS